VLTVVLLAVVYRDEFRAPSPYREIGIGRLRFWVAVSASTIVFLFEGCPVPEVAVLGDLTVVTGRSNPGRSVA
jgi:hypothetical protein